MDNFPVIKIEIQHMKQVILHAMSERVLEIDNQLCAALDRYCAEDNIERVINEETRSVLDRVIKKEVHRFYTHGEGRGVIRSAVEQRLKRGETWTPLDDPEAK